MRVRSCAGWRDLIALAHFLPADFLAEYLEESGFSVREAESGEGLRQVLGAENIGLILLDIGLPDADGTSLIPELIANYPGTAIIMLSGVADLHVAIDCIRKGADDYLAKPVKFNEILIVVKKSNAA